MDLSDTIKQKLRELPDKPGCYLMRDRYGHIVYVGKAASLRKRVRSYFRQATLWSAPPKLRSLIHSIRDLEWQVTKSETEAILTEGRLIKSYRPRYNTLFKDDKRFSLIRVDANQPFPRLTMCRLERHDGALYFGPYASSVAARTAIEFLEKRFGLRKCAPRIPSEIDHRHCIDDIVRFCSAPCIGRISPGDYRARVDEACAFLRGERRDLLGELEGRMREAAGAMRFEKAAAIRDTLHWLKRAVKERAKTARGPRREAEAALRGVQELKDALGLPVLPRGIEAFDVSCISGTLAVASLVSAMEGLPRPDRYRRFRIRAPDARDDTGMMAEAVRRRYARLRKENKSLPDLVLVDGGTGQCLAARAALDALELKDLPLIGLAKRYEEVYGQADNFLKPVRLPDGSEALRVLKRIRDEAHRFALLYHRLLRARRIRESVLDAVPGIGDERKRKLLRHFGSVARLRRATVEEIAAVSGIGRALAETIKGALGGADVDRRFC
ncbi:MAG: excinuclease ABC subunit UvrC [Lentisphaerae bacterium]|nr:excinuclease ABC subunit UvrC [Lentisphaerota bacterium]